MMKIMLRAVWILFSLISVSSVQGAFEQVGAGARPLGMGSAFTAISDDAHAIYYNPAGLAQVRRGELSAGYGRMYAGLKDNSNLGSGFVGVVQSLSQGKYGSMGVGWLSLSLEGAYREDLVSMAYGKEVPAVDGLFVGGSGKILKRSFGSDIYTQIDPLFQKHGSATNDVAFDLGVLYRPSAIYSFGLMLKDINQPDVSLGGGERVPLEIRGGFGYHQRRLVFDGEIGKRGNDVNVAMGLEKYIFNVVGMRAGFSAGSRNRRELSAGLSYRGNYFGLDYAFVFPLAGVESVAGSHRFGLVVKFGKVPDRARWEFEEEDRAVERLLEEKAAQIGAMEKELSELRDQDRSSRLESSWVRQQIRKLEEKLREQESKDLEEMKRRMFESKVESEKMKRKVLELEEKLRRMAEPVKAPVSRPVEPKVGEPVAPAVPAVEPSAPVVPRSYVVEEGDTLQTIAQKFYGDPARWIEIYNMNEDRIERGGTVRAGQVLLLPVK